MDATPFLTLSHADYDILTLYGYQNTGINEDELYKSLQQYDEIVVVAWSFGVRVADDFLKRFSTRLPITLAIAVNGTTAHIDDECGIPKSIFEGTLANMSVANLRKFHRRMFVSTEQFASFLEHYPNRNFDDVLRELEYFSKLTPTPSNNKSTRWSRAIISGNDHIIPPTNQSGFWDGIACEYYPDFTHFPNFKFIFDKYIINKDLVASRFSKAKLSYNENAYAQKSTATKLHALLTTHLLATDKQYDVLEIGAGNGVFTSLYVNNIPIESLTLWDIAQIDSQNFPFDTQIMQCDAESHLHHTTDTYDLILSSSAIQWFNSPTAFIANIGKIMRKGAFAAIALYGDGTYAEVSTITGISLPYPTLAQIIDSVGVDFQILHASQEHQQLTFTSVGNLLKHIKQTGVNALNANDSGISAALKIARSLSTNSASNISLSFCPIYIIIQKNG